MKIDSTGSSYREVRNWGKFPPKKISFNKQNVLQSLPKNKLKSVSLSCLKIFLKKKSKWRSAKQNRKEGKLLTRSLLFLWESCRGFSHVFPLRSIFEKKPSAKQTLDINKVGKKNINISEEYIFVKARGANEWTKAAQQGVYWY